MKKVNAIQKLIGHFDRFQKKHHAIGFPLAVVMKFGDDQAGNEAALLTYYAFVSLFPLLLVSFTLISVLAGHDVALAHRAINGIAQYFPVVGKALESNIHEYHRNGWGLLFGLLVTFYGARGVANSIQNATNHIWQIPRTERPGFPWNMLRSFGIIIIGGGGLIATSVALSYVTGSHATFLLKIGVTILALICNSAVFLVVSRLATARRVRTKHLLLSAVLSAIFWQILQAGGSFLLLHELQHASALYGTFAVVLGLLAWFYLQAQFYVYAIEITAVRFNHLWPRTFAQPFLTKTDKKVYARYAESERRNKEQRVLVEFDDSPEEHK